MAFFTFIATGRHHFKSKIRLSSAITNLKLHVLSGLCWKVVSILCNRRQQWCGMASFKGWQSVTQQGGCTAEVVGWELWFPKKSSQDLLKVVNVFYEIGKEVEEMKATLCKVGFSTAGPPLHCTQSWCIWHWKLCILYLGWCSFCCRIGILDIWDERHTEQSRIICFSS